MGGRCSVVPLPGSSFESQGATTEEVLFQLSTGHTYPSEEIQSRNSEPAHIGKCLPEYWKVMWAGGGGASLSFRLMGVCAIMPYHPAMYHWFTAQSAALYKLEWGSYDQYSVNPVGQRFSNSNSTILVLKYLWTAKPTNVTIWMGKIHLKKRVYCHPASNCGQ